MFLGLFQRAQITRKYLWAHLKCNVLDHELRKQKERRGENDSVLVENHTKCIGLRPTRPFSAHQTICASDLFPWQRNLEVVYIIGSAGSASYIVREVHSVRERERYREREREKDGSDVTIVALKLAMSFALLLAKNVHLSIGEEFCAFPCQKICTSVFPLLNGAEFTLSVAKKRCTFRNILRTVTWRDWQAIEAPKQTIEFPTAPFFFIVEKINQINTKNYRK